MSARELRETIEKAVELIARHDRKEDCHHKSWIIDQVVRTLIGETGYTEWTKANESRYDGPYNPPDIFD
jgi:hypothetical protein